MIWIKEHATNKIPIIMSVSKLEIMRSGAQTVISFAWVGGGGEGEMDYI